MRFFTPLPNFLPWLKDRVLSEKKPLVECGCGRGDLVREARAYGIPTLGIDPRFDLFDDGVPQDLAHVILPMEAENCCLVTNTPSILLVCRPCHSGFPGFINAARHPESSFYYVGFEKNIEVDLLGATTHRVMDDPVGEDGEMLYRVEPHTN